MDANKFKDIEELYQDLKYRHETGEVSEADMKSELKKLMVRDDDGHFWMIGSKTGGWYVYDGKNWNAADPYAPTEKTAVLQPQAPRPERIELVAPIEKPEAPAAADALCKFCHSRLNEHDTYCNFCGGNQKAVAKSQARPGTEGELLVKAVRIFSVIFFFGGIGLVIGVICGASFGIFKILGDFIYQFPMMLQEMRGKIQGGLVFGAIGGIGGFIVGALLASLLGLFYNAMAFVFGGLRFKVRS
jgi:hypothetical protein